MIPCSQRVKVHPGDGIASHVAPAAGLNGALQDGQGAVRDDEVRIHLELEAQTGTGRAGAVGVVEGEHARAELRHGDPAVLAGVVQREGRLLAGVHLLDDRHTAAVRGCGLHGVGQAARDVAAQNQAVHDEVNIVLFVLFEGDVLGQIVETAVHADAGKARFAGVGKDLLVLTLLAADDRGQDLEAGPLGHAEDLVHHLVDGLLADLLPAVRTVRHADPGPEQTQIVKDLRDRAHGGAGVLGGRLLVDGDGGRKAVDGVHVRLVHLSEEHSGVAGKGFHVAALALGIDRIEGQRRLAGAGKARKNHEPVTGDRQVDILEVVRPGAPDNDVFIHKRAPQKR